MSASNSRNAARGMFLVAAELCKHGFNVTPTSRNMAGADLLITDDNCRTTWTIQVKVTDQTSKRRRGWLLGRNVARSAHKTHAYVFVVLKRDERPDFYVVPSEFVATHQSGASSMPEFRKADAGPHLERWSVLKAKHPAVELQNAPLKRHASIGRGTLLRSEYMRFRRPYEPENIRLIIVAESPPVSGRYFYNSDGATTEPLFSALMQQLRFKPATKRDGLREFQRKGWVLVDATYEPVNDLGRDAARNRAICRDYHLLCEDLAALVPDRSAPLILIKANICRTLEPKLRKDGFNVLNRGHVVPFPAAGQQPRFHQQFRAILTSAGIL